MEKIEWRSPQYIHTDKSNDWYWIVGIITASIALIAIILNNIIFAVLIIVCSFTLSLFAHHKPEVVTNEIGPKGVRKGMMFYPYDHMECFWVETGDHYPRILFKLKQKLSQFVVILIQIEDADNMTHLLSEHIPEERITESLFEKILIYFGF